jgi:hypothetical protein
LQLECIAETDSNFQCCEIVNNFITALLRFSQLMWYEICDTTGYFKNRYQGDALALFPLLQTCVLICERSLICSPMTSAFGAFYSKEL